MFPCKQCKLYLGGGQAEPVDVLFLSRSLHFGFGHPLFVTIQFLHISFISALTFKMFHIWFPHFGIWPPLFICELLSFRHSNEFLFWFRSSGIWPPFVYNLTISAPSLYFCFNFKYLLHLNSYPILEFGHPFFKYDSICAIFGRWWPNTLVVPKFYSKKWGGSILQMKSL